MLVGGALFLGGRETTSASQLVALIEAGDGDTIASLVVAETLPNVPQARVAEVLNQRFASGSTATEVEVVEARGQRLTRVVLDGDLVLCERPDGGILVDCSVAEATLEASEAVDGLTVQFGAVRVTPGQAQVQLVVVNTDTGDVTIERDGIAIAADGDVFAAEIQAAAVDQFGPREPIDGDITVAAGGAFLLVLNLDDADFQRLSGDQLTVDLDGREVVLTVVQQRSFLS